MQRGKGAVQHVIDALVAAGPLDGADAGWLLYDAYEALVARGAGTIGAGIDIGYVVTDGAEAQSGFQPLHGFGERSGIFVSRAQDMEGESLGALGSNAGQLLEFFNEPRHWFGIP